MGVGSVLELYTTLLGWQLYGNLWQILSDTGLGLVPFVLVFLSAMRKGAQEQGSMRGSIGAIRQLRIELPVMAMVFVLAGVPVIEVNPSQVQYQESCSAASTVNATNGNASYSSTLTSASTRAPIWWGLIMSISGGLNYQLISAIPCETNYRRALEVFSSFAIEEPALRAETNRFYSECYVPARSKYNEEHPENPSIDPQKMLTSNYIQAIYNELGENEISWLGSYVFLGWVPNGGAITAQSFGYYNNYYAYTPVPGFAATSTNNLEPTASEWGRPSCFEWWVSAGNVAQGLRYRLHQELESNSFISNLTASPLMQSFFASFSTPLSSTRKYDEYIRRALVNTPPSFTGAEFGGGAATVAAGATGGAASGIAGLAATGVAALSAKAILVAGSVGALVGGAAVGIEVASFYGEMWALRTAAPIIKALLLMFIYAMLPLVLVFMMYDVRILFVVGVPLMGIYLFDYAWAVTRWLDNSLIEIMYPEGVLQSAAYLDRSFLDAVTQVMYMVFPLVLLGLFGLAGYKAGHMAENAMFGASRLGGTTRGMIGGGSKGGKAGAGQMRTKAKAPRK